MSRASTKVNKQLFLESIKEVEANGPLDNLSELYKKVSDLYFTKDDELSIPITPAIVIGRIKEWNVELKTQKGEKGRGRSSAPVDRNLLTQIIVDLENKQEFKNLSHLYIAVSDEYNKNPVKPITNSIVMLRILEWEIPVKTQKGKKGNSNIGMTRKGPRLKRSEKFAKDPKFAEVFNELRKSVKRNGGERFLPLVNRAEKGSLKAAVQLHCLDCCAYQTKEVKNCSSYICPQWAFRPYQKITEEALEVDDTAEFAEETDIEPEEMVA